LEVLTAEQRECAWIKEILGRLLIEPSSTRFIVFDQHAKIITEHQAEFEQILPHAGWHEQDPEALVQCMVDCINTAVEKLEWMGWDKDSIKGIGEFGGIRGLFFFSVPAF